MIGQAKGILMERFHLTSDQAFEELRASSQKHNRKVRDIAARLVISTGKKKGHHPSPATVMRMLREHDEKTTPAVAVGG